MDVSSWIRIGLIVGFVLFIVPMIVASFLRNVEAGTIRLVSWLAGGTVTYRGPGKSKEIPLLTTGTTISSKVINVDLDITDQTADIDDNGIPRPIKVRVLASAIVSVGDSDQLIKTAANRFFSKSDSDQTADIDDNGIPRPIKVRVLASAIVSVGDSDQLIKTAANRFFSKSDADQ